MAVVSLALEEGFEGDTVIVKVNGRQVFERNGVSTRTQIGLAESFDVPVDEHDAVVEVQVPTRGASGSITHPVGDRLHVGVSVQQGDIVFRTSEGPFGYV
jgi:hypothetical protein